MTKLFIQIALLLSICADASASPKAPKAKALTPKAKAVAKAETKETRKEDVPAVTRGVAVCSPVERWEFGQDVLDAVSVPSLQEFSATSKDKTPLRGFSEGLSLREEKSDVLFQKDALWECCAFSRRSPFKESYNEDAVGIIRVDEETVVFAVADGCGGMRGGEQASSIALQVLSESIERNESGTDRLRIAILDGIEQANIAVQELKIGAACTIAVVEYHRGTIRPYHVGDSMILVTGNRGRVRYQSVSHSPVGFAVESGMLAADDAMHHQDRHIVSNVVGDARMRIEIGPAITLSQRDTVVIASDGLFDNLSIDEVVDGMRKGKLAHSLSTVTDLAYQRMLGIKDQPCKPDDLSVIAIRPSV